MARKGSARSGGAGHGRAGSGEMLVGRDEPRFVLARFGWARSDRGVEFSGQAWRCQQRCGKVRSADASRGRAGLAKVRSGPAQERSGQVWFYFEE